MGFYIQIWQFTTTELVVQYSYAALIMLLLIFGIDLLTRYIKADKSTRQDPAYLIFFTISIALIGYALYNIPAMMVYFYGFESGWFLAFQQLCIAVILFPFGVISDKILVHRKQKVPFYTYVGCILIFYLIILMVLNIVVPSVIVHNGAFYYEYLPVFIAYAFLGFAGIISVGKILLINLKPLKMIRRKILAAICVGICAFIVSMLGGIYRANLGTESEALYILNRFLYLFLWMLMRYLLLSIPSYSEFDWKNGIVELYVMHGDSGLLIYSYSFRKEQQNKEQQEQVDSDLVSGGIIGIRTMLEEIARDKGKLKHIEIGKRHLIFSSAKAISCFLLCEHNHGVYYSILQNLGEIIEQTYPQLIQFNGNLEGIDIKPLIEKIVKIPIQPIPAKTN